jgi:hypothetical protein
MSSAANLISVKSTIVDDTRAQNAWDLRLTLEFYLIVVGPDLTRIHPRPCILRTDLSSSPLEHAEAQTAGRLVILISAGGKAEMRAGIPGNRGQRTVDLSRIYRRRNNLS